MKTIKITWLENTHECETCGCSWARGARVEVSGEELAQKFELTDEEDVYKAILKELGYEVDLTYE